MDTIRLLAIFAENKAGQLARVTGLLSEANINIRWVAIASTESFGVVKLLVEDPDLAYRQLKHNGVPVSLVEVLAIEVQDQPGGLHRVANCLAENHINIENASGFVAQNRAVLLIEASDPAQARRVLEEKGLKLLGANAVYGSGEMR
jgi:hypothetical protein